MWRRCGVCSPDHLLHYFTTKVKKPSVFSPVCVCPHNRTFPSGFGIFFLTFHLLLCVYISVLLSGRKERERRSQAVRRSAPDSAVLTRLRAQMAEVRSKMADVKGQLEARTSITETRISSLSSGPDPGTSSEPEMAARRKPGELRAHAVNHHTRHGKNWAWNHPLSVVPGYILALNTQNLYDVALTPPVG